MHQAGLLVVSYLGLRKAIGVIGIALPLLLVGGNYLVDGAGIERSISHYYYTPMRDVLVGSLCAIGVFLCSYRGYTRQDHSAGILACVFAVVTALFPTQPDLGATPQQHLVGTIHLGAACALFLMLAFFALVLFRKTDPNLPPTPRKALRNRVYALCGTTILGCITTLFVVVACSAPESPVRQLTFWIEWVALYAFGWAWFIKGEGLLKDC